MLEGSTSTASGLAAGLVLLALVCAPPAGARDESPRPPGAEAAEGGTLLVQSTLPGSDTSTLSGAASFGYGKPNQSRIWFNGASQRWDALVPRNDGEGQGSDHWIVVDVAGTPAFTDVELENRDDARPDVFWDDENGTLYVLGSHAVEPRLWRVVYDAQDDTYAIDSAVNGVAVPGMAHDLVDGENRPASLYRSPNGRLWAAVVRDATLRMQQSLDGGETWAPVAFALHTNLMPAVTTWTHFDDGGQTYLGLFVGENGADGLVNTLYYYWIIRQQADPLLPGSWIDDSANIPPPLGFETSDDHVSAARDTDDNQYFAVKTEAGDPTAPRIKLFKRTPQGSWSQYPVTSSADLPEQTRPSLVIDDENRRLFLYTTDTGGGAGGRVQAPLAAPQLLATETRTVLFAQGEQEFDDIITPRQNVDATSEIAVLAHNETSHELWRAVEDVRPLGVGDVIVAGFQAWNDVGQGPAEFVSLFNTTAHSIALEGLELIVRTDVDEDGEIDLDWRLSDEAPDLTGAAIAPHGFFLIAESGVPAPGGVHDLETDLDLATGEGGSAERAISIELRIDDVHMDYVVYGRHDGSNTGANPPGDLLFDGVSFPRVEVIRSTVSTNAFREGVVQRLSPQALHAGYDVEGFYTDEEELGDSFPPGVWTSPHDTSFDDYLARNSISGPVPVACAIDTDGDGTGDCEDEDDDDDGVADDSDCAPLDASTYAPPGEVRSLRLAQAGLVTTLWWGSPQEPGGNAVAYEVLRSEAADDFSDAICVESGQGSDTSASDDVVPPPGQIAHFLVRATNACGPGTLGEGSSSEPRSAPACP